MYRLSEDDINRLIIACTKQVNSSVNEITRKQYLHLVGKLQTYKEQNCPDKFLK
ncbi:MAG: hypothetical protein RLZZ196_1077 [Bacteroidota bacterium]